MVVGPSFDQHRCLYRRVKPVDGECRQPHDSRTLRRGASLYAAAASSRRRRDMFAALLVPAGRVADRYGRTPRVCQRAVVFAAGSLVVGHWPAAVDRGRRTRHPGNRRGADHTVCYRAALAITPARVERARSRGRGGVVDGCRDGPTIGALAATISVGGVVLDRATLRGDQLCGRSPRVARIRQPDAEGRIDVLGLVLAIAAMGLVTLASRKADGGLGERRDCSPLRRRLDLRGLLRVAMRRHPAPSFHSDCFAHDHSASRASRASSTASRAARSCSSTCSSSRRSGATAPAKPASSMIQGRSSQLSSHC